MEAQLAERDQMMKQSFEESQRHAREAEELRMDMLQKQENMQLELARKAQEERRGMLETDSESWVRVLLTESRRDAAGNSLFIAEIDELEVSRQALSTRDREQSAFISVLQHNLQKEVINFLQLDREHEEKRLESGGETSNEEQVGSKLLLEQMLLKMKSLREELQSQAASKAEVVDTLYTMARAAEAQIERAKDSLYTMQQEQQNTASGRTSPFDYSGLEREVADLELFVEIAGRQSDRARENSHAKFCVFSGENWG